MFWLKRQFLEMLTEHHSPLHFSPQWLTKYGGMSVLKSLCESKEDENENTSFKQLTPQKKDVLEEHYENYLKNNGYTDKSFDANMQLLNKHLNTAINGARRHIDPKRT